MFQQNYLYWLAGSILLVVALMSWRDKTNPRRLTTGLFWALYGLVFFVGEWATDLVGARALHISIGVGVVVMALIAGLGALSSAVTHSVPRNSVLNGQSAWGTACLCLH